MKTKALSILHHLTRSRLERIVRSFLLLELFRMDGDFAYPIIYDG